MNARYRVSWRMSGHTWTDYFTSYATVDYHGNVLGTPEPCKDAHRFADRIRQQGGTADVFLVEDGIETDTGQ